MVLLLAANTAEKKPLDRVRSVIFRSVATAVCSRRGASKFGRFAWHVAIVEGHLSGEDGGW